MCDWIRNRNETCLDLLSGACRQRTFLSPAGVNSRNWNVKPALFAATATKTVQVATVNKSLQFRRRQRDFFAQVWGLPLIAVYVPVHDKIRSGGFAVAANISHRSGGAFTSMLSLSLNRARKKWPIYDMSASTQMYSSGRHITQNHPVIHLLWYINIITRYCCFFFLHINLNIFWWLYFGFMHDTIQAQFTIRFEFVNLNIFLWAVWQYF